MNIHMWVVRKIWKKGLKNIIKEKQDQISHTNHLNWFILRGLDQGEKQLKGRDFLRAVQVENI